MRQLYTYLGVTPTNNNINMSSLIGQKIKVLGQNFLDFANRITNKFSSPQVNKSNIAQMEMPSEQIANNTAENLRKLGFTAEVRIA